MRTQLIITALILILIATVTTGCDTNAENLKDDKVSDLILDDFPEYQAEIQSVLDGIFKSIQDGDADKLIFYHIYGP